MTHLILHKVRGQPAFDVADRCDDMGTETDPGPWWIIPTSGQRAYPIEKWELSTNGVPEIEDAYPIPEIPSDWPDHYQVSEAPARKSGLLFDIGSVLRDLMPAGKFPRRA